VAVRGQHSRRRPGRTRLIVIGAAIVVLAAAGVVGLLLRGGGSGSPALKPAGQVAAGHNDTTTKASPMSISIQPPDGASDQPLNTKVAVTTTSGQLSSVLVTGADGKAIAGQLDSARQSWQSAAALGAHTKYTVAVQATSPSGQQVQQSSTFMTLTPKTILQATIFPGDGLTVGVGMPIELRFNHSVTDKAAVLAAMHVTMSTPVAGGWHWFSDKELHFRPEVYWQPGEQVTLTANLAGVNAGGGMWADTNHTVKFTVGDAHVSTADVGSHVMTVTSNGTVVGTYPLSAGRNQYPTMNGVHIALYRQQDVIMDSQTVGIPRNSPDGYYEHVFWDVAITDGGEFVHAAPWSTGAQGRSNVSHGCINLSVPHATAFFNLSRVGDIINVTNSPRAPSVSDHGTMDWNTPWDQWIAPTA
jgi:lipoprotein-anchoring transpeptidase ErfK/SrfK